MCVLSIKAPIRKKSGSLFNDPRIYIYIYIYRWIEFEKRAWRKLYKNATSYIEQILEAISHKTATVGHLFPISKAIQIRRTRHMGHCRRSKDELISDVPLWTPSHGRTSVGRPARTHLSELNCKNTGYSLEDLPEAMDDRDEWRERDRETHASDTR